MVTVTTSGKSIKDIQNQLNSDLENIHTWLLSSMTHITLCQHGKFPATLLLMFFVIYYKRNIKHFFRIDIQLYQHS